MKKLGTLGLAWTLMALTCIACGGDATSPTTDSGANPPDSTTPETNPDTGAEDTVKGDVNAPPDVPPSPCVERCAPFIECGEAMETACMNTCAESELAACEAACLVDAADCEQAAACLGVDEYPVIPLHEGPYGTTFRDRAGPFELTTLDGGYSMAENWTGQDSHIFILYGKGNEYTTQLWASEVFYWLKDSPLNVHYFFMAYPYNVTVDISVEKVNWMKDRIDPAIEKLGLMFGKARECHWRRRIHYVTTPALLVGGWIQDFLNIQLGAAFAIDRFQRLRNIGLLSLVNSPPYLYHLLYEARYFDFEWMREQELNAQEVTESVLLDGVSTGGGTVDVELPSANEMATFNALSVDLTSGCLEPTRNVDPKEFCGEWDTGASLSVSEHPLLDENSHGETACQAKVNAVEAAEATLGSCGDGLACVADTDCVDGTPCVGYVDPVEGVAEVPADTLPCSCAVPGGAERDSVYSCKDDGSGYKDCLCNESFELARWITTYSREGRWVHDLTAMLPLLKNGGKTRFHYSAGNKYVTRLKLRFRNTGQSIRPTSITRLFTGGKFNLSYNGKYEPLSVDIPATAKKVEILAHISGHGWGSDIENCAEFCNHTHHFSVNGTEFMHDQPWVGKMYGCAEQVPMGTVPNQYGTWTIGRAGWCPGKEVTPFIADVTAEVTPGETATITYKGLFDGQDYEPKADPNGNSNGFGANIWMESWLVVYE